MTFDHATITPPSITRRNPKGSKRRKEEERLALHINSWQVNANIFKVMPNAFLRDFYFSL